jgi:hypothetical protein
VEEIKWNALAVILPARIAATMMKEGGPAVWAVGCVIILLVPLSK